MTEQEANVHLELLGEQILSIEGVKYVAVVNDIENDDPKDFALEIGYNEDKLKLSPSIISKNHHILFQNPLMNDKVIGINTKKVLNNYKTNEMPEKIGGLQFMPSKNDFNFQNNILESAESGDLIYNSNLSSEFGTLGGIITLKNYPKEYFFISNWHVMMHSIGQLGHTINFRSNGKEVGKLFWGVYNSFYDLAIGKITNHKIIKPKGKINKLMRYEKMKIKDEIKLLGDNNIKPIYSKNAHVKVGRGNEIFKNQILTKKISVGGHSGSIVTDNKEKKILGVLFAGDEENFSICNHLHKIFSNKIPKHNYTYGKYKVEMPEIEFKHLILT